MLGHTISRELLAQWCRNFNLILAAMDARFGNRARIVNCTPSAVNGLPVAQWAVAPDPSKE